MIKTRFSMLLLEPGEIYFEDYSCTKKTDTSAEEEVGRLKLCSKSLVFEPSSWSNPLLKMYFKDCIDISSLKSTSPLDKLNVIKVKVTQYADMLKENILTPYNFIYELKEFIFVLDFANAEESVSQMQQLLRASTLHAPEHNSMVATILHSRYMRMVFDPVMMDDFSEDIICEMQAEKISPLIKHQGKVALTNTTLYFQPFNNIEYSPVMKLKLSHMRRLYKRRFLLRHVGLEIYNDEGSPYPHIYLSFQNEEERDHLYNLLESSPNTKLHRVHVEEMTLQWQNGIVSNYDYLVYLNCLADRSKNDLTQYPVFPWVVSDYKSDKLDLDSAGSFRDLSKPMGALNPERLERLMERFDEMGEPKFMYGSHYSAPGLVLFYLVRKYPQYMLCLQNGRFDHPDRMFNAIVDVYNNCLNNMSDFKELVPEFYDTSTNGDFLVNDHKIYFGDRHDGSKVGDVALPKWADSPKDFVCKLREALESDYVSRHLHMWIDLIFGYKQRGEEAVKAYNVFYHLCYEGAVDLECIYDMNDRHALEVQIMEFGQVPKQLFTRPHVRKITQRILKEITHNSLECIDNIQLHREAVTYAVVYGRRVVSVGRDGALKVYDREMKKQIRSVVLCSTPLSSCVMIGEQLVAAGSWDNDIYLYDMEYGRVVESYRAHDDSVSCLMWLEKERVVVSGGWDCVVRVWGGVGRGVGLRGLKAEFDHDGKVTALTHRISNETIDLISGTSDGEVCIWNLSSKVLLNKIPVHSSGVTALCYVSDGRLISASEDGDFCVTDLTVSHLVYQKKLPSPVTCLSWDGCSTLWLGCKDGNLLQWNLHTVTYINEQKIHEDSITSIHSAGSEILSTASQDRTVKLWRLISDS